MAEAWRSGLALSIGIDIGSTYTKYCILGSGDDGEDCDGMGLALSCERTPVMQREHLGRRLAELRERYGNCPVVSCGYGRRNAGAGRNVSELTALARGAACMHPGSRAVLDIGGQDTKLVCHRGGKIERFFVNERCAAGSGMFLSGALSMLGMPFEDIDLRGAERPGIRLTSVCAVFAQGEIVGLIADGASPMEIAHAVLEQVIAQAKTLIGKAGCDEALLSGGLTRIPGIGEYAERILGIRTIAAKHGSYLAAIGCAHM